MSGEMNVPTVGVNHETTSINKTTAGQLDNNIEANNLSNGITTPDLLKRTSLGEIVNVSEGKTNENCINTPNAHGSLSLHNKTLTLQDILDHSTNGIANKNIDQIPGIFLRMPRIDAIKPGSTIENSEGLVQDKNNLSNHDFMKESGTKENSNDNNGSKSANDMISIPSSNQSTATVKMFQRMDELSVRMIAMEEMLHTLCNTVNHQNTIIMNLESQSSKNYKSINNSLDKINNELQFNKLTNNDNSSNPHQDAFVTDMLNSITNVSSKYLRNIKNRSDNITERPPTTNLPINTSQSELDAPTSNSTSDLKYKNNLPNNHTNTHEINNSRYMHQSKSYSNINSYINSQTTNNDHQKLKNSHLKSNIAPFKHNNISSTFTLNPNGIKKRKNVHVSNSINDLFLLGNSQFNLLNNIPNNIPNNLYKMDTTGNNPSINGMGNTNVENAAPTTENGALVGTGGLNPTNSASLPNLTLESAELSHLLKPNTINNIHNELEAFQDDPQQANSSASKPSEVITNDVARLTSIMDKPEFVASRDSTGTIKRSYGLLSADDHEVDDEVDEGYDEDDDGYQEDNDDDNENDNDNDNDNDNENDNGNSDENGESNTSEIKKPNTMKRLNRGKLNKTGNSGYNGFNKVSANKELDIENKRYSLLKAPNSVRTIWEEYVHGINGEPAIKDLEEEFGSKWRKTKNRKTFARRKRLYKFILKGIENGKTSEEMISILENRRLYKDDKGNLKRRTIGWLQQSLSGI
ncbi:hypothetical protein TPHA_0J02580 [Tetrapisispora phaffii CBS 4417]|uniref:Transcription activator GCR1-like domain-containing protein n=1 Tax=Tetrapisispora phaffii (strain ATCC 24235 / CBS 4417 / NBRC 1672 / NRRL Y-8282 / UCD 70-5) TaxID=1071381 RepID=G8BYY6_TETPH|nr:hypothetical protein TPHA_0J02580 [Tetrapisispora phaffii CBS 4417]CCE65078.1 hypothetical protein TPHA_0J02580 [Tetrapisispora phaffii CBS 4417]